ncbi:MAG: hypothetical protein ACRC41_16655 [Sarcina sp.]
MKVDVLSAKASKEDEYIDGNNTVINAKFDISNVEAKSTAILKVIQNNGEIITYNGVLVNWYSNNKTNFNGINTKDLKNAKNIQIVVSSGNKNYNLEF